MRRRSSRNWIGAAIGLLVVVIAAAFVVIQAVNYSRAWAKLPPGLTIGGVAVGGRDPDSVRDQLRNTFNQPVTLAYRERSVQLDPGDIGMQVDVDGALAGAEAVRSNISFWNGFVDYILARSNPSATVTLPMTYSLPQLNTVLEGVAIRFDQPPHAPEPQPGTLTFTPGTPGVALDIGGSLPVIDAALRSPVQRSAALLVRERAAPPAPPDALERMLTARLASFDGVAGVMIVNLRSGEEICLNCDVAFSGMSLLKIPIAVDTYRALVSPLDPPSAQLLSETLTLAGNSSANGLLDVLGNGDREAGTQQLDRNLAVLGLQNTFMAVPFDSAPGGRTVNTPANSRKDLNTQPDPAMQTTPQDTGLLLRAVYDCEQGGGTLLAAWPGDLGPEECRALLDTMSSALPGELIAAGVAPGTRVAQHFGWNGPTLAAGGVVYSPGGDYALSIFLWRAAWIDWPEGAAAIQDVSRATYNYFNGNAQVR